jgi:hypothetical protein
MLSVTYAECRYGECCYVQCRYAECHGDPPLAFALPAVR